MPLGHLGINVPDLTTARVYFDPLMPLLGYEPFIHGPDEFSYRPEADKPGTYLFFYTASESGVVSRHRSGLQHLAFIVPSRDSVDAVYELAVSRGDEVLHAPVEFPQYHPGYYATFWVDPFGHMLEAVCHRQP